MIEQYMFIGNDGESHWPQMRFELMWLEHGGSGLGMAFSDVNELDLADVPELIQMMRDQKKRESDAIRNARRRT